MNFPLLGTDKQLFLPQVLNEFHDIVTAPGSHVCPIRTRRKDEGLDARLIHCPPRTTGTKSTDDNEEYLLSTWQLQTRLLRRESSALEHELTSNELQMTVYHCQFGNIRTSLRKVRDCHLLS